MEKDTELFLKTKKGDYDQKWFKKCEKNNSKKNDGKKANHNISVAKRHSSKS